MRGNETIIQPAPGKGNRRSFVVKAGQTWYPGMIVQVDPATNNPFATASPGNPTGLFTGKIFAPGTDGAIAGANWVVTNDNLKLMGKLITDSYSAGETASVYCPNEGDILNLLVLNIAGTADDHAAGEILIADDTTGKFIATTGSPERKLAVLLEAITDPTADTLAACEWAGR